MFNVVLKDCQSLLPETQPEFLKGKKSLIKNTEIIF